MQIIIIRPVMTVQDQYQSATIIIVLNYPYLNRWVGWTQKNADYIHPQEEWDDIAVGLRTNGRRSWLFLAVGWSN